MKKKTLGLIAGICSLGMMLSLSACGSNGGSSAKGSGDNIITAYNSEPQNALIPGIRRTAKLRNFTCFFRVVTHSSERFYFCHIKNLQIIFRSSVSSPSV